MHVVEATLISRRSPMGGTEMQDNLLLGKKYRIDLDSIRLGTRLDLMTLTIMPEEIVVDVDAGAYIPTGVLAFPRLMS